MHDSFTDLQFADVTKNESGRKLESAEKHMKKLMKHSTYEKKTQMTADFWMVHYTTAR